jgi:hypothetical protein
MSLDERNNVPVQKTNVLDDEQTEAERLEAEEARKKLENMRENGMPFLLLTIVKNLSLT